MKEIDIIGKTKIKKKGIIRSEKKKEKKKV